MAKGFKTGGRTAGTPNKATTEFRQTITSLLQKNAENVDLWLQQVANGYGDAKPDPAKALDLMAKLAEYGAPKLGRVEHVGDEDAPISSVHRIELVPLGSSKG
jgi:hypothetical protein